MFIICTIKMIIKCVFVLNDVLKLSRTKPWRRSCSLKPQCSIPFWVTKLEVRLTLCVCVRGKGAKLEGSCRVRMPCTQTNFLASKKLLRCCICQKPVSRRIKVWAMDHHRTRWLVLSLVCRKRSSRYCNRVSTTAGKWHLVQERLRHTPHTYTLLTQHDCMNITPLSIYAFFSFISAWICSPRKPHTNKVQRSLPLDAYAWMFS